MPLLDKIREEKLIDLAKACFDPPPTGAEEKVLRDSASSEDLPEPDEKAPRPEIRPEFLRWLATDPDAAPHIDPKGLRVYAATIPGKLDLRECHVNPTLEFFRCDFQSEINLQSAETRGLYFFDSSLAGGISADRVIIHGPLNLLSSDSEGEIRLLGAEITGQLACKGAKVKAKSNALHADGAKIGGGVFLVDGFESSGTILLAGAKIKGDLSCSGAKLQVKDGNALYADNAEIGGNVLLNNGFESSGIIRLPGAHIKGNLYCSGAQLRVKDGNALHADGAEIGGSVFLNMDSGQREDFESSGTIRLPGAHIKGNLYCSGAKLKVTMGDALFADCAEIGANVCLNKGFESSGTIRLLGARIGGELAFICAKTTTVGCKDMRLSGDMWWMGIQNDREAVLDLTGASLKNLRDDRESWPAPGRLILGGLTFEELTLHERPSQEQVMNNSHGPELPFNVEERIKWLMLQPEKVREKPQPWMQLRDLLERKGDRKGAKYVLFRFRCLQAQKSWTFWRWLRIAFAWLEENPLRICWSIAFTLTVFTMIFAAAFSSGAMLASVQIQPNAVLLNGESKNLSAHYPLSQSFLYTLENAVPLVKLGIDEKWMPDPKYEHQPWFPQVRWLNGMKWFNSYWLLVASRVLLIFLGWFQAGVLGAVLLRRFKE
jgi:hypothetical protein